MVTLLGQKYLGVSSDDKLDLVPVLKERTSQWRRLIQVCSEIMEHKANYAKATGTGMCVLGSM